jgi:hypothetical protein
VALITPFNFPLEIPALQLMGALYMGNKPVLKVDSKVSRRGHSPLPGPAPAAGGLSLGEAWGERFYWGALGRREKAAMTALV